MELFLDVLSESFVDTAKMLPFLFLAYLFIEYVEHRHGERIEAVLESSGRWGAIPAALLGCVPQCGFSAIASNFYASRVISLGTLIAVFLATSDEAVPLLVSMPAYWDKLVLLMVIKVLYAIAVGLVLDKQTAEDIYRCWQARITDPANYAVNGALLWRYVLAVIVSRQWFADQRQRNAFREHYLTHLCKGAAAQADREKVLRNALNRLTDVDSYRGQIIEKPDSKEAAEKHLADDAAAFRYTPKKGALKERELLLYTKDSILRLLEPIGLTSDLYSTFCGRCEEEGLLVRRDHTITLQGGSFHGVAFDYAKLTAYQS